MREVTCSSSGILCQVLHTQPSDTNCQHGFFLKLYETSLETTLTTSSLNSHNIQKRHTTQPLTSSPTIGRKMNLRLVLIAAKACLVSSMVARTEEGYGFEIVSDIGQWLEMEATNIAFVPDRSFLRGSNYTDFDTVDEGRDFDSEMDEDLEVNYEWNSNATLIDYKNGDPDERQLAQLSARDRQWLNSHNKRRRKYHKKFNKKYVPLKWSPKLKRRSKKWAKHLANQCGRKGIYHGE